MWISFWRLNFCMHLAGNQAQFKMIDLRLCLLSCLEVFTVWDMELRLQLKTVSLLLAAMKEKGAKWYTIVYEPANWIPFIFYFAVGAVCGYVRMKNRENLEFISEENKLIQEKFLFMRDMYQETLRTRKRTKNKFWAVRTALERFLILQESWIWYSHRNFLLKRCMLWKMFWRIKPLRCTPLEKNGYGRSGDCIAS